MISRWAPVSVMLFLQLLLGLPTLAEPPCGRDSWRETDGLIVAANMCHGEGRLFFPQVDARGQTNGITGMEWPLLNWMAGRFACLGAPLVSTFRGLSLATALLATWALYLLGSKKPDRTDSVWTGLLAAGMFAFSPLALYYGRTAQPDMAALAFGLLSLCALERGWLWRSALLLGLGILLKLPLIVFGLPALMLLLSRHSARELFRRPASWGYAAVALIPAVIWYRHARMLQAESGLYIFKLDQPLPALLREVGQAIFYRQLWQHLWDGYVFFGVTVLALASLGLALLRRRALPALHWALPAAGLASIALSGYAGVHHLYYGLPLTAGMCLLASGGFPEWGNRSQGILSGIWLLLALAFGLHRIRHWHAQPELTAAFVELREHSKSAPAGQAAVFSNGDPTVLYWLQRTGFILGDGDAANYRAPPSVRLVAVDIRRAAGVQPQLTNALPTQGFRLGFAHGPLWVWER